MLRIFAASPWYVQGPGAIKEIGPLAGGLGTRAAVVIDANVLELYGKRIVAKLSPDSKVLPFSGEITLEAVDRLVTDATDMGCDVAVAIGGGKALDAGKAVALRMGAPVITVPTIASTDAPASRGIAIYDREHRLALVQQLPSNPQAVVVDTEILAAAPPHFLSAGIGDAIAKKFEAEGALAGGGLNKHGTRPLLAGLLAADGCYRALRQHGAAAVKAAGTGVPTDAFEAVVEACFLLSALGFENTGLSIAHSVTRGLVKARQVKDVPHGFHVAYGLLVQLVLGEQVDELDGLRGFYREVGLPTTLSDMGMTDVSGADFDGIAELTMTSPHIRNFGRELLRADIRAAVAQVEAR